MILVNQLKTKKRSRTCPVVCILVLTLLVGMLWPATSLTVQAQTPEVAPGSAFEVATLSNPVLTSPAEGATAAWNKTTVFYWSDVGASKYRFRLLHASSGTLIEYNVASTNIAVVMERTGTWRWSAAALNAVGTVETAPTERVLHVTETAVVVTTAAPGPSGEPTYFGPSAGPEIEPTPIAPNAEPTPIAPNAEPTPIAPNAEPTPIAPNAEPTPIAPNAEPTPIAPNAEPTPIAPSAEPTPIAPSTEPTPAAPELPSSWAASQVMDAISSGLIPVSLQRDYREDITRAEFCSLIIQVAENTIGRSFAEASPNPFVDTSESAVLKAYRLGIIRGVGAETFAPNQRITRQEICVMLYRTIQAIHPMNANEPVAESNYADRNAIANWAYAAVRYCTSTGVVNGMGDNRLNPLGLATREQAMLMALRLAPSLKP